MNKDEQGFSLLHQPSLADRRVPSASKASFTGHLMVGGWPGRVLYTASWLELRWAYCLDVHPTTAAIREQAAFNWRDRDDVVRTHYFDLLVDQVDGRRVAYSVKPEVRLKEPFLSALSLIAHQAREGGFVDDVRLLTDADLDPVELDNAMLMHAWRAPDPHTDRAALEILQAMSGVETLGTLAGRINLGAAGRGALIRLIRSDHLRLLRHELITAASPMFKNGEKT